MSILLLCARLVLAVVFIVAGIGKLLSLKGSQQAMKDFGVPGVLAPTFGVLLPFAELAVAVALVFPAWAWWGAVGAAVLLLLFVAGIAFNLTLGRKPDCHCFGVFYSSAISKKTLIRNLALVAIAGFIIWQGMTDAGPSMVAWMANLTIAEGIGLIGGIIVIALLAIEGWMLFEAMRQIGKLVARVEALEIAPGSNAVSVESGLPEGTNAPHFELPDLSGELFSLDSLLAYGKPIALVFTDSNCGPCVAMMPELGKWMHDHSNLLTFAVISRGDREENLAKTSEHGVAPVLLQKDREVFEAYLVRGTPSALIIRPDGSISTMLAEGEDAIRELINDAVYVPTEDVKRKLLPMLNVKGLPNEFLFAQAGHPAPDLTLPDLNGYIVKLSDFLGSPTLLLYWDPGCGFCQAMLRDLKAWEARPPKGAPQLLIVTNGSAKEMKRVGLRSTVVIDEYFSTASLFNIKGTPTTVFFDEEGNFTNQRAVDAPGFFMLANSVRSKPKVKPATV